MKRISYYQRYLLFLACGLSSCSADVPNVIERQSLIVQVPLENVLIATLQENLRPQIEHIMQEEMSGHTLDKNFPLFFFKRRQAITIYYMNDCALNARDLLFAGIDMFAKNAAPKDVAMSSDLAFFGEDAIGPQALVDLVMMIHDPKKELFKLNQEMKGIAHKLNHDYKKAKTMDMYDMAKSERFPYMPHLALGHLRANHIKGLISDQAVAQQIIERIKKRIICAVEQALTTLFASENKTLLTSKVNVYDLKTRDYIKSVTLKEA